jgi:hypothetical protein
LHHILALILNYKRKANIPVLVDSIRRQSLNITIALWNNGTVDTELSSMVDHVIHSETNLMCLSRWHMAALLSKEYFFTLDSSSTV